MTSLRKSIEISQKMSQYDTFAKRILADRQVLSRILSRTVSEFDGMSYDEIASCIEEEPEISTVPVFPGETNWIPISPRANEDSIPYEGTVVYDVRFFVRIPFREEKVKIIINIEGQKNFYPGYHIETRGIFYGARLLSAQLDTEFTEPHYDQLKKVYSIWLCFESSKEQANAIAEYAIQKKDLIPGIRDCRLAYDKMVVALITLNEQITTEDTLIGMLNTLFGTAPIQEKKKQLSEKYGMYMERELGKELESMCNMSGYILERGIEQGMERGIEQGMERGIAEGEARFGKLIQKMIADGRSNEIPQVASDQKKREHLYKEYHL